VHIADSGIDAEWERVLTAGRAPMALEPFLHWRPRRKPSAIQEADRRSSGTDCGETAAADLSAIEDEEICNAVAIQERVGIRTITAGELRRNNWRDGFFERVEGFRQERIPSSFVFAEYSGEQRRGMPVPTVVGKLRRRQSITADDFAFLKLLTRQICQGRITLSFGQPFLLRRQSSDNAGEPSAETGHQ
jgi:hypothetical protein